MKDGISAGIAGYDGERRKAVRKAAAGLRLKREVAMSIASKEVSISFHYSVVLDAVSNILSKYLCF